MHDHTANQIVLTEMEQAKQRDYDRSMAEASRRGIARADRRIKQRADSKSVQEAIERRRRYRDHSGEFSTEIDEIIRRKDRIREAGGLDKFRAASTSGQSSLRPENDHGAAGGFITDPEASLEQFNQALADREEEQAATRPHTPPRRRTVAR